MFNICCICCLFRQTLGKCIESLTLTETHRSFSCTSKGFITIYGKLSDIQKSYVSNIVILFKYSMFKLINFK